MAFDHDLEDYMLNNIANMDILFNIMDIENTPRRILLEEDPFIGNNHNINNIYININNLLTQIYKYQYFCAPYKY